MHLQAAGCMQSALLRAREHRLASGVWQQHAFSVAEECILHPLPPPPKQILPPFLCTAALPKGETTTVGILSLIWHPDKPERILYQASTGQ